MIKMLLSKVFRCSKTKFTWRWYVFRCRWFGIKVHWIRDTLDEWHTHPWNGFSLIFGSYVEQRELFGDFKRRWLFNRIGAFQQHRIRGNCLTLFVHGPRVNEDWYWGEKNAPWRGVQHEDTNLS